MKLSHCGGGDAVEACGLCQAVRGRPGRVATGRTGRPGASRKQIQTLSLTDRQDHAKMWPGPISRTLGTGQRYGSLGHEARFDWVSGSINAVRWAVERASKGGRRECVGIDVAT